MAFFTFIFMMIFFFLFYKRPLALNGQAPGTASQASNPGLQHKYFYFNQNSINFFFFFTYGVNESPPGSLLVINHFNILSFFLFIDELGRSNLMNKKIFWLVAKN